MEWNFIERATSEEMAKIEDILNNVEATYGSGDKNYFIVEENGKREVKSKNSKDSKSIVSNSYNSD